MKTNLHHWLGSEESTCTAGGSRDSGLILGSGRSPGEGNGNPRQYSCWEKSQRQRSLVGFSPWGQTQLSDHSATTHICSLTHIYKEKLHKTIHTSAMCKQIISSILLLKILFLLCLFFEAGFHLLKLFHNPIMDQNLPTLFTEADSNNFLFPKN